MTVYTVETYGARGGVKATWRCQADNQRNAVLSLDAMMQAYELIIQRPNEGRKISFDMSVKARHAELAQLWPSEASATHWFAIGTEHQFETGNLGQVSVYREDSDMVDPTSEHHAAIKVAADLFHRTQDFGQTVDTLSEATGMHVDDAATVLGNYLEEGQLP